MKRYKFCPREDIYPKHYPLYTLYKSIIYSSFIQFHQLKLLEKNYLVIYFLTFFLWKGCTWGFLTWASDISPYLARPFLHNKICSSFASFLIMTSTFAYNVRFTHFELHYYNDLLDLTLMKFRTAENVEKCLTTTG